MESPRSLSEILSVMDLEGGSRRVLIVEDLSSLRIRLSEVLRQLGHDVVDCLGVEQIEDGIATGPGATEDVKVDLRSIHAAFLDHYFLSRTHNGRTLVREIRLVAHPRILAMSSSYSANEAMLQAGADEAIPKSALMSLLGM